MGSILDELLSFSFSAAVRKDFEIEKEFNDIFFNLIKYKETGDVAYLEKERQRQANSNGIVETNDGDSSSKKKRQKEAAPLADITENVIQSDNIAVKKEKTSIVAQSESILTVSDSSVKDVAIEVKKETEDMPAPRKLPPRKKKVKTEVVEVQKRSTRTRTKPRKYDEHDDATDRGKQSDVMIQNTTITTIDITEDKSSDTESITKNGGSEASKEKLVQSSSRSTRSKMRQIKKQEPVEEATDSQASEAAEPEVKMTRSTRTKTLKKNKRIRSVSSDQEKVEELKERKKSKSNLSAGAEINKTSQTEYEDAISTIESNEPELPTADATYVATVDAVEPIFNNTIVLETRKSKKSDENEQMEETKKAKTKDPRTPPKPKSKKKTKEIFSPFEKTPLKKKVEAFEKLQSEASGIPIKTKTRMQSEDGNDNRISGKPKAFTPFSSKFLPKTCSTSKVNKMHPGKLDLSTNGGDSMLSIKSLSALKASQAEFKEREKKRQEKEREALKKREALLLAQTEDKRRRREEKQLKAQQHREILEKEKQKLLEEHKRKEEKYKQAIAEKEEKLIKQKEEADKKRLLAKKKAELIKEKEHRLKEERSDEQKHEIELARQIQKQKMQRGALPIYMTTKAPLLPTDDCYDSDDSDYTSTNKEKPEWAKGRVLEKKLITMEVAGQQMKNTLFCRHAYTPDLQEIFVYIDPQKLKRTSSAIWRKPPRYTLFTGANNIHFSEDSEEEFDL